MADELIIETTDLRKSYGGVQALDGLDLRVPRGAVCGLLGRNGAGKTTTIKVLLGMARPSSGQARIFGLAADDVRASVAIRARTAFVSEDKDLYAGMTVGELMRFTAPFYPKWRAEVASAFFAVAMLLSTVFNDVWRPMLLTVVAASVVAVVGMLFPDGGLYMAMAGGEWFYGASLPWLELLISGVELAALIDAAGGDGGLRDCG